jgi:hypothetical protein
VDGYAISINGRNGDRRYRHGGQADFELTEAAQLAADLLERASDAAYVTVGNGEHEFRLTRDDGDRWEDWYVDAEIGERRWQYRPMADLSDYGDAQDIADPLTELPEITRIWFGRSDGSEEFETVTREA